MGAGEMVTLILMVSSVARMMSRTIGYPGYLSTLVNKSWEDGSVVRVLAPKVWRSKSDPKHPRDTLGVAVPVCNQSIPVPGRWRHRILGACWLARLVARLSFRPVWKTTSKNSVNEKDTWYQPLASIHVHIHRPAYAPHMYTCIHSVA